MTGKKAKAEQPQRKVDTEASKNNTVLNEWLGEAAQLVQHIQNEFLEYERGGTPSFQTYFHQLADCFNRFDTLSTYGLDNDRVNGIRLEIGKLRGFSQRLWDTDVAAEVLKAFKSYQSVL